MAEQENEQENEPIKSNLDFTVKLYRICCLLPSENRVKPTEGLEDANHPIVTHLTEREIYNFEKIWKLVQKSLPDIGKKTFVRYHFHLKFYISKSPYFIRREDFIKTNVNPNILANDLSEFKRAC